MSNRKKEPRERVRARKRRERERRRNAGAQRKVVSIDHVAHASLKGLADLWDCDIQTATSHLSKWAYFRMERARRKNQKTPIPPPEAASPRRKSDDTIRGRVHYLSLFSGVECLMHAVSHYWRCWGVAQFDPKDGTKQFAARVLARRLPRGVENLGDVTKLQPNFIGDIDLIVGGSPCQSFSRAGARNAMTDPRGRLTRVFMELAMNAKGASSLADTPGVPMILWENVPDVLLNKKNRTTGRKRSPDEHPFCIILGMLGGADDGAPLSFPDETMTWPKTGYYIGPQRRVAWRVLDASLFGLPQQRQRLFLVATRNGDGLEPINCLFDKPPPLGPPLETPQGELYLLPEGSMGPSEPVSWSFEEVFECNPEREARFALDPDSARTIRENALKAFKKYRKNPEAEKQRNRWILNALARVAQGREIDPAAVPGDAVLVDVYGMNGRISTRIDKAACTVTAAYGDLHRPNRPIVARREEGRAWLRWLMPVEAERLMGLPDNWTRLPDIPEEEQDGDRFRAIGNGIAVPPLRWICERIEAEFGRVRAAGVYETDPAAYVFNPLTRDMTAPMQVKEEVPPTGIARLVRLDRQDRIYDERLDTEFALIAGMGAPKKKGKKRGK